MAATKRMRGIAVHRPILIGSTATPLTPAEKLSADPLHTHKWTVAVRSAASNPLPTHVLDERGASAAGQPSASGGGTGGGMTPTTTGNTASTSTPAAAAIGTRGRDTETDYHKHVGGKDDVSHFIRRVQFKLHDSFPQPVRTCDRPPYQVTETGWGEFEVQIKIFWVTESAEKPLQTFHYLKLHPWNPLPPPAPVAEAPEAQATEEEEEEVVVVPAAADGDTSMAELKQEGEERQDQGQAGQAENAENAEQAGQTDQTGQAEQAEQAEQSETADAADAADAPAPPPAPALPPVVHSWQYDEIVFPEPTEAFYQTLLAHPPTPLPAGPAQAFTDPNTSRLQGGLNRGSITASATAGAAAADGEPTPPYPLHAPSAQPYTYGISQTSIQAEADRLDIARIEAVRELERERNRLIAAEKELRMVRARIEPLVSAGQAGDGRRG